MQTRYRNLKSKVINNTKVVENYFFMTALQVINSLFGILIYPYLIRVLGAGSYGLYVFALSVTSYFIGFITFGFTMPAVKGIVKNKDNPQAKSKIVSSVLTAKFYLSLLSTLIFVVLLFSIPVMKNHKLIFAICFSQIFAETLLPVWYFQGVQKMRIITYIQLGIKVLSLPFIFLFIHKPDDCYIYVLIASFSLVIGAILSNVFLVTKEDIRIKLVSITSLKVYFNDALPFFWSNSTATIKQESVTIIIGAFFGMRDVAYYDLANKIILLPRMLTTNINGALFPKVMERTDKALIKKIIRYEVLIGLGVILSVVLFGYWIILLLGGKQMVDAYPLAIIISASMMVWLIVGSYINFIFVPQNKYYFVTRNQFMAFISFIVFCVIGILIFHTIAAVVLALTLSGYCEIVYCNYLIRKHKLL